jgi:type 1 glutamine amidotransferase
LLHFRCWAVEQKLVSSNIMLRNLILSGGVAHDYERTSAMLVDILHDTAIESDVSETFDPVEDGSLSSYDILCLNCVRWTCSQKEVHPSWPAKWRFALSQAARKGFMDFLSQGKGVLGIHAAAICFDDWAEFPKILGGRWEWGFSRHTPVQEHRVRVVAPEHPIVEGVGDFIIEDELYTGLRIDPSSTLLIEGEWEGKRHPLLWLHRYGESRVCYNAFGHGVEAFSNPSNRLLLQRTALWVAGELGEGCPS